MSVRFRLRDAVGMLPSPTSQDSKYTRGVVGLMTGSERYPGAGVLSASAALRAGAGYVRYVGPDEVVRLLLARHPEAVVGEGRADCWVIGSGLQGLGTGQRADEMRALLDPAALHNGDADVAELLERLEPSGAVGDDAAPAIRVVDAGALVDFGSLVLAAQKRGLGPGSVDSRPGTGARTGDAETAAGQGRQEYRPARYAAATHDVQEDGVGDTASDDRASVVDRRATASRSDAAGMGARSVSAGMDARSVPAGMDVRQERRQERLSAGEIASAPAISGAVNPFAPRTGKTANRRVSAARLTPAVRRGGLPSRSAADNPLIQTADDDSPAQEGQDVLDPAAFWKTPAAAAKTTADTASVPAARSADRGSGSRADRLTPPARQSELQKELENARRGHSHPLPGVLARNMVGVSRSPVRPATTDPALRRPLTAGQAGVPSGAMTPGVRTISRTPRRPQGTGNRKLYVITPHTGELARLMSSLGGHGVSREEVESDRRAWAQRAADRLGCVVALKGAHTFVAAPGQPLLEVVAPTYWLSTAGTGDVLAGTLGTVLAQLRGDISTGRTDLQHAVALGVYLHGYAGGIASGVIAANPSHPLTAEPLGMAGESDLVGRPLLAMDVASALPYAVHALLDASRSMGPSGLPPRR